MRSMYRHFRFVLGLPALAILLVASAASALTMTPVPPNISVTGPTSASMSWNTDVATGPSHLWYGPGGAEWTEFAGLTPGDIVRDIDVFDSNRAFLVASTLAGAGRLYVGNRQVGGNYTWNLVTNIATIPNSVAAENYDTVWYAGYSTSVIRHKISTNTQVGSFNSGMSIVWSIDEAGGTVWAAGTSPNLISYNIATSGPATSRPTNITSLDPAVTRYTKIEAYDANNVWAVADLYVSMSSNAGVNWVNWNSASASVIEDIKTVAADEAFGVGRNGWVYHMKGSSTTSWTKVRPTTLDLLSLGAPDPNTLFAFGCCNVGSVDYMLVSYNGGVNWSSLQNFSTSLTASNADYISPTSGFRGGSGAKVEQYQAIYPHVVTVNGISTSHTANLSTGLQEGVTYHAVADSYIQVGLNDYSQSVESNDYTFTSQGLDVNAGPTVTPQTTSARIDWGTTLAGDTRAYVSPTTTWKTLTNVAATTYLDVAAVGSNATAVGYSTSSITKTNDVGVNFTTVSPGPNFESISMIGRIGWAVGGNSIYNTTDGSTWSLQSTQTSLGLHGIYAADPLHVWAVGTDSTFIPSKGFVLRSNDGGATWSKTFTPDDDLLAVTAINIKVVFAASSSGKIFRSVDGGTTWIQSAAPGGSYRSIDMADDGQNGWAVGLTGLVAKTSDGGRNWSATCSGTSLDLLSVSVRNQNEVWAVGSAGTVVKWAGGPCFATQTVPGITSANTLYGVSADDANVWIVGSNGVIARNGLDTSVPSYKAVTLDSVTPVTSHTTGANITGLTANTTYDYFVQTYDVAGLNVIRSGTLTTLPVPTLDLSTSALSFSMTEGGVNPSNQTFIVRDQGGANVGNWTATKTSGGAWLSISPAAGSSSPSTVTVSVNGTGLTAAGSPYTGTIQIDATDAGVVGTPKTVTVTLTVAPPASLSLSATTLNFSAEQNGPNPAPQAVSVSNSGAGIMTYTLTPVGGSPWLAVASTGTSPYPTPNQVVVSPDITGLTPGNYTARVTVTGNAGTLNSPQDITVNLTVTQAPTLDVTWTGKPAAIAFAATQTGPNPASKTMSVANSGAGTMNWTATTADTWLQFSPASGGNGPTTVTISPQTGSLGPGTYNGTITVNAGTAGVTAVPVTFTVAAAPVLSLTPTSLSFSTPQGTNPSPKNITVTSGSTSGWAASVTLGSPWLNIGGVLGGTVYPSTVITSVEVVTTGLAVGSYNGTVRITSPGSLPAFIDVAVTLQVTAPPVLQTSPVPELTTFTTEEGKNPAVQSFGIDNVGGPGTTMNWTITQPAETWVRVAVTPCNGTYPATVVGSNVEGAAPTNVNVCIDTTSPALLVPGSYTSSFTIQSPGSFGAPKTIAVSLSVTPDSSGPTVTNGSVSVTTGYDCTVIPADVFAHIRWDTSEFSDSQIDWGEQLNGGVPLYELGGLVRDAVNTASHTGGVTSHDVLLDNLVGGHRYYIRFRSTDRYGNISSYVDHDPVNASLYLSFVAPAACDTDAPTNITLTVPPNPLFGTATFNMSAQDQSGIDHFVLMVTQPTPIPSLAVVTVPPAACTTLGGSYSCLVSYGFATNSLSDGSYTLALRAFDAVGNYADSPIVSVDIDNAVPTVSNIVATPRNVGGVWEATISWDTDKQSGSRVDLGIETPGQPFVAPGDYDPALTVSVDDSGRNDLTSGPTNNHNVTIRNLIGGQIYHFQVSSCSPVNPLQCGH